MRCLKQLGAAAGIAFVCVCGADANGYKILGVKSVKASSMGDAVIASVDDASASAFNPAGLARVEGGQVEVDVQFCNAYSSRTAAGAEKDQNVSGWQTVPSFFVASDLGLDKAVAGLAVTFPNGLSSEWPADGFARYVSTYSSLRVADISPAVGMQVTDKLTAGIGLDFYYSDARLEKMLDMGLAAGSPGAMDVESRLDGDGTAWGFNAGVIYELNAKNRAALTYRHAFTVNYDGVLSAAGNTIDAKTSVDFPASVVAGYAFVPTEKWTVEADADWTYWKGVGDIRVDFADPGMADTALAQDLRNTVAYKLGAQYKCSEKIALRAGYIHNENATPGAAWRPSLPDADNHFLTAGIGYESGRFVFNAAFQMILYESRTIDNNVDMNENMSSSTVDGTYRTHSPVIGVSTAYRF